MSEKSSIQRASPCLERVPEDAEFQRILECPVCREIPFPPIYSCIEGHMVCSECRPKLSQCGLCKQGLSNKRNYPLEAIVINSYFKCPYKQFGCERSIRGESYHAHLSLCDFRPISCFQTHVTPCFGASVNYRVDDIIQHLKSVHQIYVSNQNRDIYPTSEWTNDLTSGGSVMSMILKYDGKYFFKNSQTQNFLRYWWVSMLGTEEEAQEYHSTITLTKTKDEKKPKMEWMLPVHSFRKSFKEIQDNGYYASVHITSLKNFCRQAQRKDDIEYKYTWSTQFRLHKNEDEKLEKRQLQVTIVTKV